MSNQLSESDKARIKKELNELLQRASEDGLRCMFTHYYRQNLDDLRWISEECVVEAQCQYCATTCILLRGFDVVARGAAVVSYDDLGYKPEGRRLSLKRALVGAREHNQRLHPKGAEYIDVPLYKSETMPELTVIEASRVQNFRLASQKTAIQ